MLNEEALAAIRPAMEVKPCTAINRCKINPQYYGDEIRHGEKTIARISAIANRALAAAWEQDKATHAANAGAIAHNLALRDAIRAVMHAAGIADTFRAPDPKSRSRFPKSHTQNAGWLQDLGRCVPVSDGFGAAEVNYTRLLEAYGKYAERAGEEKAAAERAEAAAQAARLKDIEFAKILVRYDMPASSTWRDVLSALRAKDQCLDLAIAMENVRGDWNDGCDEVSDSLGRFDLNGERNIRIGANVAAAVVSFSDCRDERVFRDCEWNYNALYQLIEDQQLVRDARTAREHVLS